LHGIDHRNIEIDIFLTATGLTPGGSIISVERQKERCRLKYELNIEMYLTVIG